MNKCDPVLIDIIYVFLGCVTNLRYNLEVNKVNFISWEDWINFVSTQTADLGIMLQNEKLDVFNRNSCANTFVLFAR